MSHDSDRLHQLLSLQDDENVSDLIHTLECRDISRLKQLESKTPDVESAEESPDGATEFYAPLSGSPVAGIDIGEYFENELRGANGDIHFTKTPDPCAEYGDLEWTEASTDDAYSGPPKIQRMS